VDHIIRVDEDGGAPFDERNYLSLCTGHHNRKSAMEGKGMFAGLPHTLNRHGEKIPTPGARAQVIRKLKGLKVSAWPCPFFSCELERRNPGGGVG